MYKCSYFKFRDIGFTLIELLVIIAILATIMGVGLASYNTYNDHEQVRQATADVANALNLARSRSQSQTFPANVTCLNYYWAVVATTYYQVFGRCLSPFHDEPILTKYFPSGVTASPVSVFIFQTLSGTVINNFGTVSSTFTLTKNGYNKTITVQSSGVIGVN